MFQKVLTFDFDVTVPLEVVIGSLPRVTVLAQQSEGRSGADWYITNTVFICINTTNVPTEQVYTHFGGYYKFTLPNNIKWK